MGLLARIFGRREQRLSSVGWGISPHIYAQPGGVPAEMAEQLAAITACIELLSGVIGSLPVEITIDTPQGRIAAPPTAPAWRITRRPNDFQSWPAFMRWAVASVIRHGNAVALVDTDGRGAAVGLVPLHWRWLSASVLKSASGRARLCFDVVSQSAETDALGLSGKRLFSDEVLHLRARSDYGILGRSPLSRASAAIREALEIQTLAEANWRNGMRPSAVVTAPTYLTKDQRARREEFTHEFSGAWAAGRVPLLEGNWRLDKWSMSSVDAQFIESRAFAVGEACRLLGVPEPLILTGNRSITDLSPFICALAQCTLAPLCADIEQEFDHSVLPAGTHLSIDLGGLMRGSFSAATSALSALVQSGVITANDAREELGWEPHTDGDALMRGRPPVWPADGTGMPSPSPKPGPSGDMPQMPSNQNKGSNGRMPAEMMQ